MGSTESTEPMDLDERKGAILRAVVEEYVETAEPVGSQRVAGSRKLGVSSATVRNDMTVLEREGYITQPYTSAGRIPTDLGYRYFVDHFTSEGALRIAQRRASRRHRTIDHRARPVSRENLGQPVAEAEPLTLRTGRHVRRDQCVHDRTVLQLERGQLLRQPAFVCLIPSA